MAKIIAVTSGKGGVGKTTTVANLGLALSKFGIDCTIIDGNFTTPDLSIHFGAPIGTKTIHDAFSGKHHIQEAIHLHPMGLKIIPASISVKDSKKKTYKQLKKIIKGVPGDIILIDTAAGLGEEVETVLDIADEIIVVTNPEWPAITDGLKASLLANGMGKKIKGVIINKVRGDELEPNLESVPQIFGAPIIGKIPEDRSVRLAINTKNPVVISVPDSDAAIAFSETAAKLAGIPYDAPKKGGIINYIKSLFR